MYTFGYGMVYFCTIFCRYCRKRNREKAPKPPKLVILGLFLLLARERVAQLDEVNASYHVGWLVLGQANGIGIQCCLRTIRQPQLGQNLTDMFFDSKLTDK